MVLDPTLHWTARLTLALLFGAAAFHKLSDLAAFRQALARYELTPAATAYRLAPLLAGCELALAVSLLPGWRPAAASLMAVALLALYSAAIGINLARGRRDFDCGCGPQDTPLSEGLLIRNLLLMIGAAALSLPLRERTLSWLDGVTIAAAVTAAVLLYAAAETIRHNDSLAGSTPR